MFFFRLLSSNRFYLYLCTRINSASFYLLQLDGFFLNIRRGSSRPVEYNEVERHICTKRGMGGRVVRAYWRRLLDAVFKTSCIQQVTNFSLEQSNGRYPCVIISSRGDFVNSECIFAIQGYGSFRSLLRRDIHVESGSDVICSIKWVVAAEGFGSGIGNKSGPRFLCH